MPRLPVAMGIRCALVALLIAVATPDEAFAQGRGPRVRDSIAGIDKLKHFLIAGFVESVAFAGFQAAGAERSAAPECRDRSPYRDALSDLDLFE